MQDVHREVEHTVPDNFRVLMITGIYASYFLITSDT